MTPVPAEERTWNDVVMKFTDCGVCGVPATNWIKVCEGYVAPRCYDHRLDKPYQAESRLAAERERSERLERTMNTVLLQSCNGHTAPDSALRQMLSNVARTAREALSSPARTSGGKAR